MIKRRIINFLAVFFFAFAMAPGLFPAVQGSGGPDDGGYIYEDSNDPNGPVYNWEEISTTGTAVSLANNAMSSAIDLPFPFRFYGIDYNQIYISSNGFLSFLSGQPDSATAAAIPGAATPNAIIAGYWVNLNPSASGASVTYMVTGTEPNRRLIIEFNAVPHNGSSSQVTFEFKLFEGSNNIEVHYNAMTADGNTHTVGIENEAGSIGLQYYNGLEPVPNSFAVRYSLFTGVALRPSYEIQYGPAGTSLIFTQRVANWTGSATTFSLTNSGATWPTTITMGDKDFTTVTMENGESQNFMVKVDIPAGAEPGDYSQVELQLAQDIGGSYEASSTLITAVPRRGYGLGYYDIDATESAPGIVQVDTKFHNSLHEPINVESLGAYINYGRISPDGQELWVVDSGSAKMAYAINVNQLHGPYTQIPTGGEASDVAFTPDGKTAVISSYGDGNVELVDTSTYAVTSTLKTGSNSLKTAIGACFPRKAYVTNNGSKSVSVVNLQSKTVTNITGFNKPHGVVVSPTTNRAYVANGGVGTIMVIDTLTDKVIATWNVGGDAMADLDITPDGSRLYVASNSTVKVVDANNGTVLATIATPVDKLWDVEAFPEGMGNYVYVTSGNLNYASIMVIDTTTNQLVKQIQDAWGVMGLALFPAPSECNVAPIASFTPVSAVAQVNKPFSWTNTTIYGATDYTWDFGDGTPVSHEEHPTHTYTTAGTYTVTLTASNSHGTSTATGTVNFSPVAAFTPQNSVIQAGDTIAFKNASTGTEPLTYKWDFGDGTTSAEKEPAHTYTTIGDYTVTLTVSNAYGTASATGKVDFPPSASFTPVDTTIRPGEQVTFTNTSTGTNTSANPLTFLWDFGDGSTSTEASPTHTFVGTADVTVSLTAHNGFGTDSTATGKVKFQPKAQFTPTSANIVVGGTVTFTNQSIGPEPLTYLWDFGDGSTSSEQSPTHTYDTVGEYPVTLTVTNQHGSDSVSGKVIAYTIPTAAFTQSASVINVNDTVTFTNTTTGTEPITYNWDFGDGSPNSSEKNPQHQYTKVGNYTVTLTATNPAGSNSKTSQVHFFAVAAFSPTNSIIQTGDSVTFTNQSTGSTPLTYTWDFGDGTPTSTDASPTHQYTTAGSYTVTLTTHNPYGPDSKATGTVVFKPAAKFTPVNSVIQVGDTVTFTNQSTGTGEITYVWDFGDGSATSTAKNPTHQYTKAGAYTVSLTATSATYGSHKTTGTILFAPTASFTPTNSVIQVGDSITFSNTSVGTNTTSNPLTYVWDFGDGTPTSTTASPTHQYTKAGTYTVTLTAHNGLGSDSKATGTVVFKPKAAFTPLTSVIHVGDSVTFSNQSTGTGTLTYVWDFGDGSATSTDASPTHQYTQAGAYTVTLTATSATYGSHKTTGTVSFAPTASFTPSSSVIQTGDSITFTNKSVGTNTASNPLTYVWDFGDGSPASTAANPTHQYTKAGTFTVKLTAHNGLGSDSTATGTVVFKPNASFTPLDGVIQLGESITFTNQTTGTPALSYTWDFGDGSEVSHATSPTHQYQSAGVYTVTLTATNSQGTDTITGQVAFSPVAAFTPESSPDQPLVIRVGDTVDFTDHSTGTGPLTYTWDFGDGTAPVSNPNPSHTYDTAGIYTVRLTVKNAYGSQSATGTVVFAPTAAFDPQNNVIHLGEDLNITNLTSGSGPMTYTWDFGDGTPSNDEATPSHIYQEAGEYTIHLRVSNAYGTDETTGKVVFAPTASFTSSATLTKMNEPIQFTSTVSGTKDLLITWDFGDGSEVSHEANPTHEFTKSGKFTVTLTVSNPYGKAEYSMDVFSAMYQYYLPTTSRQ